jgi:hypothetical protein
MCQSASKYPLSQDSRPALQQSSDTSTTKATGMKCYDCVRAKASTGIEEIEIQDAYTQFDGDPICREHLAGKLSHDLGIGWNVVLERLA